MVDIVGIGVILGGLVLLLAGAVLSLYGVALLGALVGAGLGSMLGPIAAEAANIGDPVGLIGGIVVGGLIGIVLAYAFIRWAIALFGLVIGGYYGAVVIAPAVADVTWYLEAMIGLAIGLAVAAVATIFTKTLLIILTAAAGSTLASANVTLDNLDQAASEVSLSPLTFDLADPIFLGLFAVGLLVQFGLLQLGAVKRFAAKLPGSGGISGKSKAGERV